MLIIMVIVSIVESSYGAVLLFWQNEFSVLYTDRNTFYIATVTFLEAFAALGSMCIIWFVTFKYWETARQLNRFFRLESESEIDIE